MPGGTDIAHPKSYDAARSKALHARRCDAGAPAAPQHDAALEAGFPQTTGLTKEH
jgi:hypothetical protein